MSEAVTDPRPWGDRPHPSPVIAETGHVPCNEPLTIGGIVVEYCQVWVKRGKPHKGKHRVEWSSNG